MLLVVFVLIPLDKPLNIFFFCPEKLALLRYGLFPQQRQLQINSSSQHPSATSPIFLPLLQFLSIWHHRFPSRSLFLHMSSFIVHLPSLSPWLQALLTHTCTHTHVNIKKRVSACEMAQKVSLSTSFVEEGATGYNGIQMHPDHRLQVVVFLCAFVCQCMQKPGNKHVFGKHF